MRGKKAKFLRLLAGYSVTKDRPQLPEGGWIVMFAAMNAMNQPEYKRGLGTCALPKDHPRRKYQFLKKRYGILPLAHSLQRSKRTAAYVKAIGDAIQVRQEAEAPQLP